MATHDYNLANQTGADFRADLNDVLQAVLTLNSSATEPTTTAAYMLWLDTANGVLKIRNGADDAWVILPLSISADNTVDINAGTIDGISQLTLGSSTSVNSILDEDNLNSDSPTALATQQSIKAYVDSQVTAQDLDFQGDSGGVLSIDLDSEIFTLNGGTGIDTVGSENTVQFNIDSTVVTLVGVQVLTNKSIDADDNTITNLEVDNLKAGVLDIDLDAVSASDDTLASAKAIKTYVDANITAQDLDVSDGTTSIAIDLDSETLSLLGGTGVSSTASGNGVTFAIGQPVGTTDDVTFGVVTANLTGQVSDISNHSTSDLSEGTNLYYTTARFDTRLATKDTDDLTEGLNLYWTTARGESMFDTRLATKDTDSLSEGTTNLYYTTSRVNSDFDTRLATKDTSDLTEGTNLYYTTARFDSAFSGKSTTNLSEGTNLYYTDARFDTRLATKDTDDLTEGTNLYYTSARFDSAFTGKSTSDLSEGTNLYYTDTRANSAIDTRVTKSFVDALGVIAGSVQANSVALGTDTTGNYIQTVTGTANKITVTGSGSESADITITLPDDVQIADSLTVAGNLTVNGTLTSLDTTNLDIEDNLFQLNAGLTGSPVNDSGMLINRGNQDNGIFMWDESADKFTLGLTTADGSATGNITLAALGTLVANIEGNVTGNVTGQVSTLSNHDTADLAEGTNLYYTDARADARVNLQTGANLDLSSKSTSDLSEGTNEYFTTARARSSISATGDLSYNSSTGVISFTASAAPVTSVNTLTGAVVLTTANIGENTNLYYTDARARAAISESSTQLAYNSTTGVLTFTQGDTDTVSEGTTNLYYTTARFDSAFSGKTTTNLSEGTNLYYTDARVQAVSINNVVEDTTPQLGGDLASNGNDILFADSDKAIFGAGSDLQIYHDGSRSVILDQGAGNLRIQADSLELTNAAYTKSYLQAVADGSVSIFYNGNTKLATTATGIDVTGIATMDGLTVDGNAVLQSAEPRFILGETDVTGQNTRFRNTGGDLQIQTIDDAYFVATNRISLDHATGDISFYEDTGTTAKFFWDASAESLGIGTTSPEELLHVNKDSSGDVVLSLFENGTNAAATSASIQLRNHTDLCSTVLSSYRNGANFGADFIVKTSNGSNGSIDEVLRITESGNVGIGTTSPSALLEIQTVGTSGAQDFQIFSRGVSPNYEVFKISRTAGSTELLANQNLTLSADYDNNHTSVDSNVIFKTDNTERMRIDSSGNVGIGTSSPAYKLDVAKSDNTVVNVGITNANTGTSAQTRLRLNNSGSNFGTITHTGSSFTTSGIYRQDGTYVYGNGAGGLSLITAASQPIYFATNNTERMRIDSSGNVGIGTSSPTSLLTVGSGGTANPASTVAIHNTAADEYRLKLTSASFNADGKWLGLGFGYSDNYMKAAIIAEAKDSNARTNLHFCLDGNANDNNAALADSKMTITYGGNVGIGTSSPAQKLSVSAASGSARFSLERSNANTTGLVGSIQWNALDGHAVAGIVALGDGNDEGAHIAFNTTSAASSSDVYVSTSERMRIDSSGNVGIGTSSPNQDGFGATSRVLTVKAPSSGGTGALELIGLANSSGDVMSAINFMSYAVGNPAARITAVRHTADDEASIAFDTSGAERMRITQAGNFVVGGTSALNGGGAKASFIFAGSQGVFISTVAQSTGEVMGFVHQQNTVVGTIAINSSSTTYNTSSDARLKEITGDAKGLEIINKLNPVAFNWKVDNKSDEGLIAQEVLDIVPNAVSQRENGYYQMDYSKLVTPLIKAIQEQQTIIESLEARITALES